MENKTAAGWAEQMVDYYFSRESTFGPLVFYGDPFAISDALSYAGRRFRVLEPDARICSISTQQFIRDYIVLLRDGGDCHAYVKELGSVDLLLFSRLDEIGGKERLQQELYGILDDLYEHGRRAVIGMSVPPRDVPSLEDRIRTQLEGGLLWGLGKQGEERGETDDIHNG